MMVVFLIGLVVIILLRTLRRDFARYDKKGGFLDMVTSFPLFSFVRKKKCPTFFFEKNSLVIII